MDVKFYNCVPDHVARIDVKVNIEYHILSAKAANMHFDDTNNHFEFDFFHN